MPYLIRAWYGPTGDEMRRANIEAHVAYIDSQVELVLAAGGIASDDDAQTLGLLYLLDTEERPVAEQFVAADPFMRCGLIERVEINRWRKSYFDRKRLLGTSAAGWPGLATS